MKIVFDLQGNRGLILGAQGVVYELEVVDEDGDSQNFGLEGSINALHNFFSLGLELVEAALDGNEDLDPLYFGPGDDDTEE